MIKSSEGSLLELLSLQLTKLRFALLKLQSGEQLPGSMIGILKVQLLSALSVIVKVTKPAPAEPACNWKGVLILYVPVVGLMLPLFTETV